MQPNARQDRQFRPRIQSVHIVGGIGLGKPKFLRLCERVRKRHPGTLNAAKDVVAGAVKNAVDLEKFVPGQALAQSGDDRHATGDRRAKCEVPLHPPRQIYQFRTMKGDQLLVCRDHRLAGTECLRNPIFRGLEPTNHFDDDIHVREQNFIHVLRPFHMRGHPIHTLTRNIAIADMRETQAARRALR